VSEPSNGVKCPSCGHLNEPSRVFCHNCGLRLPRLDNVIAEVAKANEEANKTAKELRRRGWRRPSLEKIDWKALSISVLASTIKLGVNGFILAAVVLMLRPASNLPDAVQTDTQLVYAVDRQLKAVLEQGGIRKISATPLQVNQYLAAKVHLVGRRLGPIGEIKVDSPLVSFGNGRLTLFVRYYVGRLPLTLQTTFATSGGGELSVVGGAVGRLYLPSWFFEKNLVWYKTVTEILEPQLEALRLAKTITITPELVTATW